jgi:hypothetical protein
VKLRRVVLRMGLIPHSVELSVRLRRDVRSVLMLERLEPRNSNYMSHINEAVT